MSYDLEAGLGYTPGPAYFFSLDQDFLVHSNQGGRTLTLAIELTGITKRFPGVVANDNVNLSVETGEIHAVCGENGAGKSTLMKILFGMQSPDEGTMRIHGEEVRFSSPAEAINRASAWSTSISCSPANSLCSKNVILGAEPVASLGQIDFKSRGGPSA